MMIVHKVSRDVDGQQTEQMIAYLLPAGETDVWQFIHDATVDYCCATDEGQQKFSAGKMLSYNDFLDFVPDDFCKKHKFDVLRLDNVAVAIDGSMCLRDRAGIAYQIQQYEAQLDRQAKLNRLIPKFARELDSMDTKVKFPQVHHWGLVKLTTTAVKLAEDYIDTGALNFRYFFEQQMAEMTTPKSAQRGEAQA